MLVGLVALLAAAAEARWNSLPASVPSRLRVPPSLPTRSATRHTGTWLRDGGKEIGDTDDQLSGGVDPMQEIKDKLERYSDTMWSPPWLQKAQTATKAQLESAVRDAGNELERARLERADACTRAEEFEAQKASTAAQLGRTEEELENKKRELEEVCARAEAFEAQKAELENTKRELEEACSNAKDKVADLSDALEDTQDKLAKASSARDAASIERDATVTRVAELEAALAEAQLSLRKRMQRFVSRLIQRLRRK